MIAKTQNVWGGCKQCEAFKMCLNVNDCQLKKKSYRSTYVAFPGDGIWSMSQKDLLEKEMTTHSSLLAWEISCTGKSGRL